MVLVKDEVGAEFPSTELDPEESGYQDNEAAADRTVDPGDTAQDIAAGGRLDGYAHSFLDLEALLTGIRSPDRPVGFESTVEIFDGEAAAVDSIGQQIEDFRRLVGSEIDEGVTLVDFQETAAPEVGSDTVAGRATLRDVDFEGAIITEFVAWRRGSLVGFVSTFALDDNDRNSALGRLASVMDRRIDGVLAGEITAAPLVAAPTPSVAMAEDAARLAGFDLAAMMLTQADLPAGMSRGIDGYQEEPNTASSYQRDFKPDTARGVDLGSSRVLNISTILRLHSSAFDARSLVLVLRALDIDQIGEIFGTPAAAVAGISTQSVAGEVLDLPALEDSAGFKFNIGTVIGSLDLYLLFFAEGRISVQISVLGPAGQLQLEDISPLVQTVEERVTAGSP